MAPIRNLTFPLSHDEERSRIPPFSVRHEDVIDLYTCRAFQAIRELLKSRNNDGFCDHHRPTTAEHAEAWLLQRDITYALILPVLEIHRYATQVALSMLGDRNMYDLELVFRGEARGAFAWLQCFIAEENQWCLTRGCPACVVEHVFQAEPTIRIVLTACRLAESLCRASETPNTFPAYDFWLSSLQCALDEDAFWGPDLWKDLKMRASDLENGFHQMVRQCMEFEDLHLTKGQSGDSVRKSRDSHVRKPTMGISARPARLGTYKSDGKRIIFVSEESCWMQKIVLGCWTTLLVDAANVGHPAHSSMAKADLRAFRTVKS